ncbi:hypothetical protein [Streptomyces sp. H27-C3]|uniref:hypothetical protein n=1 Tax=Streptomyces sp. H27-C3 TaxID=3046305 RepID=UPI0024BBB38B|nr:hypothetical protein [Streptomyces sp. H27-C3]MDJ0466196.1 hypothetical protein [Streptomyces sp. H27-C3]
MLRWIRRMHGVRRDAARAEEAVAEPVRRPAVVQPRPLRLCCVDVRPVTEPGRMRSRLAAWRDHRLNGAPFTAVDPEAPLVFVTAGPLGAAGLPRPRGAAPLYWPADRDTAARHGRSSRK